MTEMTGLIADDYLTKWTAFCVYTASYAQQFRRCHEAGRCVRMSGAHVQGSRPGPLLNGVPTLLIDHHQSAAFPDGAQARACDDTSLSSGSAVGLRLSAATWAQPRSALSAHWAS